MRAKSILICTAVALAAGFLCGHVSGAGQAAVSATDVRVQRLEDRESIRALMADYGRTLDDRDFAAFAQLFASDGEFAGGGGATAKGRDAVGALLARVIPANYPDSKGKNFHFFTNETIEVTGDTATARSKGGFVMASNANKPEWLLLATYHDQFVREDGRWKFKRREIHGDIPTPRTQTQ